MKHRGTFDCRVDLSPCIIYTFKKNQRAPPFHHSHHASRARQLCRYLWHCFPQARSCSSFVSRKCEILYIRLEGSIQLPDFVIQSLVSFSESASLSCGSMQVASLHLRACIPLHNHPCMSQQDNNLLSAIFCAHAHISVRLIVRCTFRSTDMMPCLANHGSFPPC